DSDMPIAEYVSLLKPFGVPVFAGVELYCEYGVRNDLAAFGGFAKKYFEEGAEKIYPFNSFFMFDDRFTEEGRFQPLHALLSSPESLAGQDMRFVQTYEDVIPEGEEARRPLPFSVNGDKVFPLNTGSYGENVPVTLYMAFDGETPSVFINGVLAEEHSDVSGALIQSGYSGGGVLHAFRATVNAKDKIQRIFLCGKTTVTHIEWLVKGNR
ncbi:MAG: hypothetical protein MJ078_05815, partial [Clostridia bacterium]|nr:hypothetical protein [Clostridia bacterium]